MSNFFKLFACAVVLLCMTTLGGCEKESSLVGDQSSFAQQLLSAKSVDEIAKLSAIKDIQIIKEVEFLKKQEWISEEQYVQFHNGATLFRDPYKDGPSYAIDGKAKNISSYSLTREYVQREMNKPSARHRRDTYMYSGGTISVKVHQSVPPEWNTAVAQAVAYWNSLGTNITFSAYTSTNNILENNKLDVTYGTVPTMAETVAVSANGKFSERISISDVNATVDDTSIEGRRVIMAHELGHAIGLVHTDTSEGSDVVASIGCGTSTTDSRSIMRKYLGKKSPWQPFTTCDKAVINYYWG